MVVWGKWMIILEAWRSNEVLRPISTISKQYYKSTLFAMPRPTDSGSATKPSGTSKKLKDKSGKAEQEQPMESGNDASDSDSAKPTTGAPLTKAAKKEFQNAKRKQRREKARALSDAVDGQDPKTTSALTLFVRNLPKDYSSEELENTFSEIGPLKSSFVVGGRDFGFVRLGLGAGMVDLGLGLSDLFHLLFLLTVRLLPNCCCGTRPRRFPDSR
jgi:RNA recognition motif-containing protein